MLISRRSTLVYASAASACAASPIAASAHPAEASRPASKSAQLIQHLLIHPDEVDGQTYSAPIALAASNTLWQTAWMLNEQDYRKANDAYAARGYGLRRVNAFQTRQGVRYAAIWQFGGAPVQARHDMTAAEFQSAAALAAGQGRGIAHLDACATEAGPRFAAIWDKSGAPSQKVFAGLTAAQCERQLGALSAEGFSPTHLAGYTGGSDARFAAVFTRGVATEALAAVPAAEFHARSRAMRMQGYRLRDANGYGVGGQPFVAAVWEKV